MSARFDIEGNAAGAVKALADLNAALNESAKAGAKVGKEAKAAEENAKRLAAQADPQERYNQKMEKLADAVKHGGLELTKAETLAQRYGAALTKVEKSTDGAFGPGALQNMGAIATQITGIGSALDIAVNAMQMFREEQKKAADDAMRARQGIGQLSQLAASDKDPKAAFKSLVAEADLALQSGAASDRNEAATVIFDLAAAGIDREDRDFAVKMRSTGTLTNVGGLAGAYDAARTSMGRDEVGSFEEFASKALAAGAAAPGTVEQLPVALSRAMGSAKSLGLSDESVLAAGAILAKQAGSSSEGGTKMAALLSGIERSGVDVKGLSFTEMIDRLSTENTGSGGIFKDNAESIAAFRTISGNLSAVKDLESDIFAAQSQGLAMQAINLPNLDASQFAANLRAEAEGGLAYTNDQTLSRGENLRQAAMADWSARLRRESPGMGTEWTIATEHMGTYIPGWGDADRHLSYAATADPNGPGGIQNQQLLEEIRAYLKEQTEIMKQDSTTNRSRMAVGQPRQE